MYAVCQTPACQQTYPVKDIMENNLKDKQKTDNLSMFCENCNGIVVKPDGMARLSQNPDVITVVGHTLLNALYKDGTLHSIKLVCQDKKLKWDLESKESLHDVLAPIKDLLRQHYKIKLVQRAIDDKGTNDAIHMLLYLITGVNVSNKNMLKLLEEKK